eukprot:11816452-Alexandrium_andersonii.AAC.1
MCIRDSGTPDGHPRPRHPDGPRAGARRRGQRDLGEPPRPSAEGLLGGGGRRAPQADPDDSQPDVEGVEARGGLLLLATRQGPGEQARPEGELAWTGR